MELKSTHRRTLIAGSCSIESEYQARELSDDLANLAEKYGFDFYFKGSFDKANRTSGYSERGLGLEKVAEIFSKLDCKITTDIHECHQVSELTDVVDMFQIPAFLCRQTDLIQTAAMTGKIVNIKKGQFVNGADMKFAVEKADIVNPKDANIWLTERGSMFGINDLVVDFRQIMDMKDIPGVPVIMDCTHSVSPKYSIPIAKCANALDVDGFFFEVHRDPEDAISDGSRMIKLSDFENILKQIK